LYEHSAKRMEPMVLHPRSSFPVFGPYASLAPLSKR
jgi:hypothetical protein